MTEHKASMTEDDKEHIFPEAHTTINDIFKTIKENPGITMTKYGHAAAMLVAAAYSSCEFEDFEGQKVHLRAVALDYIAKYGEGIKKFLRPELLEALSIKDTDE